MKITIERTDVMVLFNGVETRLWKGITENGEKVDCFIAGIASMSNLKPHEDLLPIDPPKLENIF